METRKRRVLERIPQIPGKNAHWRLWVFLKCPRPGAVKTRLASTLGDEMAARLYSIWVEIILQSLQSLRAQTLLVGYFTGGTRDDFADWNNLVDLWVEQPLGNLGDRLAAVHCGQLLTTSPDDRTLSIGTDCLELNAGTCEVAFTSLERHEGVIGPASDGGYYLIGTHLAPPSLFQDIRWSSLHTLDDQRERFRELGLSTHDLPTLSDIDTEKDWLDYCHRTGTNFKTGFGPATD